MLKYKGYTGKVEYDAEENILFGKVFNANAVITFVSQNSSLVSTVMQKWLDNVTSLRDNITKQQISYVFNKLMRVMKMTWKV